MKTKLENGGWKMEKQLRFDIRFPFSIFHLLASFLIAATVSATAENLTTNMAVIPAGVFRPLFRSATDLRAVPVKSFQLDVAPVSNREFMEFVRANPRWQRSTVKRLFVDGSYLKNWAGDLDLGSNAPPDAPAVYVSWFAAKAYAQWQAKRLPTVAEWEYAASASATRPDGANDPQFKAEVMKWYCEPANTESVLVGAGEKNFFGVRDLHGLVWEWVADFNSALFSADSRDSGPDLKSFCGGGAQGAKDVTDYPAFMRYAFRSSLKADYCVHNLGFRCAKDL